MVEFKAVQALPKDWLLQRTLADLCERQEQFGEDTYEHRLLDAMITALVQVGKEVE